MTQIIQPSLKKIVEAVNGDDTQLQLLATQATRYEHSCSGSCDGTWGQKAASCCLRSSLERWQREKEPGNPNCPWESQLVPVLWLLCCAWLTALREPNQGVDCAAPSCAVQEIMLDYTRNWVPGAWGGQGLEILVVQIVSAEQGCPHKSGDRKDHGAPSSPSWQQRCLLRMHLHPCWCFLGWLKPLHQ